MADQELERRLAVIVAADIVGYSRLMEVDEAGTFARLKALRKELIDPKIAEYRGRVVKTTGDGILLEYTSVTDAVQCSVDIQQALTQRNASVPVDRRMQFRVGINLGEIIIEGDDIYGTGVNVAARLETLAEPGGICISGKVYDQIQSILNLSYENMGEQRVKNISTPIRSFAVKTGDVSQWTPPVSQTTAPTAERDKPSIAVLPFDNLSNDPEQEYFADGIAEDLITALSHFHWFYVIARNSSFTYKGRAVDVRTVGQELGARYILEGSVRKGGNRLRITAQLIEAETGNHLWAERYDGVLEEVFDLQDLITEGVVGAIEPSVRRAEIERAKRKRPENLDAYDLFLQALPHAWMWVPEEAEKALEFLDRALQIDPNYAAAHGLAAWSNAAIAATHPDDPRRNEALQHAHAVLGPDTDDALALVFAAFALALLERNSEIALDAINRALTIIPNSPIVLSLSAVVNAFTGHFETAIAQAEVSLRLSPFDPMRFNAELAVAYSHFFTGLFDDAAEAALRCTYINPVFLPGFAILAASQASKGHVNAAQATAKRLLALKSDFRVGEFVSVGRFAPELNKKYAAALRQAGLPE